VLWCKYVCIRTCDERKLQEQGVGECYVVRGFIIYAAYKIVIEGQHNGGLDGQNMWNTWRTCDMLPTYWHKNMEGKDIKGDIV